ncbi:MAG: DNA recombination protein RmuC [Pseudohongiellaceae bacterium]
MGNLLPILLGIAVASLIGVCAYLQSKLHSAKIEKARAEEQALAMDKEIQRLLLALEAEKTISFETQSGLQHEKQESARLGIALDFERRQFAEKTQLLEESKAQLGIAFKNIANEIFEDKSTKFEANNKASLSTVLGPLSEKISQFEKRVEETYDKESKERFSLAKEIKSLQELNTRISEEAVNLTNALKGDNKYQGNWGEFVLESILERSGLVKGREYEIQVSLKAEDGSKSQPDVIVHLPESRDIVIDSKVSLKAWDAYCAVDNDDNARQEFLKQHIQSIRSHVKLLSAKDYQNLTGINSLDYVFLFMPIESAYATAAQHDSELFQYAFERNIVFVVPSTLLISLRTVQNLWRLVQQNQNAKEIANKAGALYDKFVAFVDDVEDVGAKIEASKRSFEKAQNKLTTGRGNLIRRAETLRELGAKTSKQHKGDLLDSALGDDLHDPDNSLSGPAEDDDTE